MASRICATNVRAPHAPGRTALRLARESAYPFQMFKPELKMLSVEPAGNYAIRINWGDGHSSGIYSYDHSRNIYACAACRANA
jgi:DUF971 family protein